MTEENTNDDKLIAAARKLSTDISPGRDLWPGIAEAQQPETLDVASMNPKNTRSA